MRVASLLSFTALVLILACPVAPLEAQTARKFAFDRELPVWIPTDKGAWVSWNGLSLVRVEMQHQSQVPVYVIDPEGNREEVRFEIPDAGLINVYAPALGADGTIALIGDAYSSDAKATSWLGLISPDRKLQSVIRLWPYYPAAVAIAADGTIWTVGADGSDHTEQIRRFDPSGKLISSRPVVGQALKRHGGKAGPASYLVTSPTRVGWVTNAGEYFEYSLDGQLLGKYPAPAADAAGGAEHETGGAALSPANELLLNVCGPNPGLKAPCHLAELDRSTRTWRTVEQPENERWDSLIGFDGEHPLFYSASRDGGSRLRQYSRVAAKSEAAR